MERFDIDEMADSVGVDADRAREWADTAGSWLRSQVERFGDEVASQAASHEPATHSEGPADPWRSAEPHPLDLPSDEHGLALAALDSGRWEVEPGTGRLIAHGEGSSPSDALGLVRELRARDWVNGDGELTLAGRRALKRWLESH